MTPTVRSLNIGLPRLERFGDKEVMTGIFKQPVTGAVRLASDGFENDGIGNTKHHGGADKAVCVYCVEHYPIWEKLLAQTLPPGAFGENLTVEGAREEDVCIGDTFVLGTAVVQITQPRQPCKVLALRLGLPETIDEIIRTGRSGFYLRVLESGEVRAGDALALKDRDPGAITVAYAHQVRFHKRDGPKGIARVLAAKALSDSWRRDLERRHA